MTRMHDLAVVGGGVHGATAALFAARGGMDVALFDRGPLCREASGVNAGTLTLQMTRVALIPYALRGARDVGVGARNGSAMTSASSSAMASRSPSPNARRRLLTFRAGKRREAGAPIEIVTAGSAQPRSSRACRDRFCIAGCCEVDGFANAYLTGLAYRRALLEAGVHVIEEQTAVLGVDSGACAASTSRRRAARLRVRRLVLAGGVWIEPMLAWLGVRLPIKILINQLSSPSASRP